MTLPSGRELEERIRRIAESGEARHPGDHGLLDVFLRDYTAATPQEQAAARAMFLALSGDPDPCVRLLAVHFFWELPREEGGPALLQIAERHGALFDAERAWFSGLTLRGQLIRALGERRLPADAEQVRRVLHDLGPGTGPLPGAVGSVLADLGLDLWADFIARMPEEHAVELVRSGAYIFAGRAEFDAARRVPLSPRLRAAFEEGAREWSGA